MISERRPSNGANTIKIKIRTQMPDYAKLWIVHGGHLPSLTRHAPALFHYYTVARAAYERQTDTTSKVIKSGHMGHSVGQDTRHNYHQLLLSIARAYDVEPEEMTKFWKEVDLQAVTLGLPLLPDEEQYRFNTVVEIKDTNDTSNPSEEEN